MIIIVIYGLLFDGYWTEKNGKLFLQIDCFPFYNQQKNAEAKFKYEFSRFIVWCCPPSK